MVRTFVYAIINAWGDALFCDSINSYWGLMRYYNSYQLRKKMSSKFTAQINNRINYTGYCKMNMRDYTLILGVRMIPYVEWWKSFEGDRRD